MHTHASGSFIEELQHRLRLHWLVRRLLNSSAASSKRIHVAAEPVHSETMQGCAVMCSDVQSS